MGSPHFFLTTGMLRHIPANPPFLIIFLSSHPFSDSDHHRRGLYRTPLRACCLSNSGSCICWTPAFWVRELSYVPSALIFSATRVAFSRGKQTYHREPYHTYMCVKKNMNGWVGFSISGPHTPSLLCSSAYPG